MFNRLERYLALWGLTFVLSMVAWVAMEHIPLLPFYDREGVLAMPFWTMISLGVSSFMVLLFGQLMLSSWTSAWRKRRKRK